MGEFCRGIEGDKGREITFLVDVDGSNRIELVWRGGEAAGAVRDRGGCGCGCGRGGGWVKKGEVVRGWLGVGEPFTSASR